MQAHSDYSPVNQPDDTPFLFLADVLALDLINTAIRVRGKPRDLLATPADVLHWWEAAQRHYPDIAVVQRTYELHLVDRDLCDAIVGLRAALHTLFSALVEQVMPAPQAIAQVNTVLQTGYQVIEWTSAGSLQPVYQTSGHGPLLFPIALSAVTWLTTGDRQRLHRCANERCVLLFYDTTKSATRRWCSTDCMDRARSSRRYQQAKRTRVKQSV